MVGLHQGVLALAVLALALLAATVFSATCNLIGVLVVRWVQCECVFIAQMSRFPHFPGGVANKEEPGCKQFNKQYVEGPQLKPRATRDLRLPGGLQFYLQYRDLTCGTTWSLTQDSTVFV